MKITNIEIQKFGAWRDLSLSLRDNGLNVFYGPNEAGKSTLMRFIRGVLYGFKPGDTFGTDRHNRTIPWEGTLRVDRDGERCSVRRTTHENSRGRIDIVDAANKQLPEDWLNELLADTDETIFERVFAIGLQELQELSTLHDDEVSQHIYGLTLGPEGQRLLETQPQADQERRRLLNPHDGTGRLATLFDRLDQINAEIESLRHQRGEHADLCHERSLWNDTIAELRSRHAGLDSQLRGHKFLERVWTPWQQTQQIQRELDRLPVVASFPENGLARFEEFDSELTTALKCRDAVLAEANQLRKDEEQLNVDPEFQKHFGTVQGFVDQREWIRELEDQIADAESQSSEFHRQLDQQLEKLGTEWSLDRLKSVDTTPTAHYRLATEARTYQSALARRSKLKRRLQRMSNTCQVRMGALADRQKELHADDIDVSLRESRTRLGHLQELSSLTVREDELEHNLGSLALHRERLEARLSLPKWVYGVLAFFGVTGVFLAILGVITGVTTDGIVGTIYAFLGASCAGFLWAFKRHCERDVRGNLDQLDREYQEIEFHLQQTRDAIAGLRAAVDTPPVGGQSKKPDAEQQADHTLAERIEQQQRRVKILEELSRENREIYALRRRMTERRAKFRTLQRKASTARQEWCLLLEQMGFTETVKIADAFETWHQVLNAKEQLRNCEIIDKERQNLRRSWQSYRQRIEELGHRMHRWDLNYEQPLDVLDFWEEELKEFAENRKQQQRLRRDEKARRTEAAEYQERIDELKMQRSVLLVQGGATTREEFEDRSDSVERRIELEDQLALAQAELTEAAATEPELAIVEEDLRAYDPDENAEHILTLEEEGQDLQGDIEHAFENLGRIKREVEVLEADRRGTTLRFERNQIEAEVKAVAADWFAAEWAAQTVEKIRANYERNCQPAKLAAAARYLERLSCGKYRNIWTPLGKRHLRVDDDRHNSLVVEHLSNGTREQLFLAIRMALLDDFAEQGIRLPMVLDDVFVNFDQTRTEAAVDELIDFARQGHQVLFFTCHLHLAQMFESKGVEPIRLPEHRPPREERLAG